MNAGVQGLLSRQEALDVIGKEIHDQKEMFRVIEQVQPDVVVVDEDILAPNLAAILTFLQGYPKTRMVILSLVENQIQVYDMQQIQLQQLSDFLAVL